MWARGALLVCVMAPALAVASFEEDCALKGTVLSEPTQDNGQWTFKFRVDHAQPHGRADHGCQLKGQQLVVSLQKGARRLKKDEVVWLRQSTFSAANIPPSTEYTIISEPPKPRPSSP